jgi:hypothetical protein
MGNRYRKLVTEQGRKVTAFGPLFDFKGSFSLSSPSFPFLPADILLVKLTVRPSLCNPPALWFASSGSSMPSPPSPTSSSSPATCLSESNPIQSGACSCGLLGRGGRLRRSWCLGGIIMCVLLSPFFASSSRVEKADEVKEQIRDCVQEDDYSMSLAAGRYMETVGWMSAFFLLLSLSWELYADFHSRRRLQPQQRLFSSFFPPSLPRPEPEHRASFIFSSLSSFFTLLLPFRTEAYSPPSSYSTPIMPAPPSTLLAVFPSPNASLLSPLLSTSPSRSGPHLKVHSSPFIPLCAPSDAHSVLREQTTTSTVSPLPLPTRSFTCS